MLQRLYIQNLATVEQQEIKFSPQFNILTGETGAGKSVIIKAVNLILGMKCSKDLIRSGESFLSLEAGFDISDNEPVQAILNNLDIEYESELVLRRKVHLSGKNSIFINNYTCNLSQLEKLGQHLIDIHGQHAQQSLLHTGTHIDYLDSFADLKPALNSYQTVYFEYLEKRRLKEELENHAMEREQRIDFIRFQVDEIENANLDESELDELNSEFKLLSNAEKLVQALSPIASWSSEPNSPLEHISSQLYTVQEMTQYDEELKNPVKELQSGLISIEEAVSDFNNYLSRLEMDPNRLEFINQRLSQIEKLKRKYGNSIKEILDFQQTLLTELNELENQSENVTDLEQDLKNLLQKIQNQAIELSNIREEKGTIFQNLIISHLHELGLEKSILEVHIEPFTDEDFPYSSKGKDKVELLISTNPGTPLKPLGKIASGGELSRIMLAIKTSLNQDISHGTMIFDEVDTGISGRVSETVGDKLSQLSEKRQVICITHSPQIAAKASRHLRVEKRYKEDCSITTITALNTEERVQEIARFLAGNIISDKTLSVAQDMIKNQ